MKLREPELPLATVNFAGTSTFASVRVEDTNDPQSFASNSITVVVQ